MAESRAPLYRQVAENIETRIRNGDWPPGTKLPSERGLCEMFSVSQITVRRALRELAHHDLVVSRHGVGWYVVEALSLPTTEQVIPIIAPALDTTVARLLAHLADQAALLGITLQVTLATESTASRILASLDHQGSTTIGILAGMASPPIDLGSRTAAGSAPQIVQLFAPVTQEPIPLVTPDQTRATTKTTQHLLSLGHRRVAYAGLSPHTYIGMQRYQGFAQALWDTGIEIPLDWVFAEPLANGASEDRVVECITHHAGPSAMVCADDNIAARMLVLCARYGLRCPDDLAVVGAGDDALAQHLTPPLTSYAFDLPAWAQVAMAALRGEPSLAASDVIRTDGEVVVRSSCGAALGGQDWLS